VFCCGTGLDFPHILNKVGPEGKIIGVDFSKEMLAIAEKKILKYKWGNIELLQKDVTDFEGRLIPKVDAGVCTLGLSIIPDFKSAYRNLLSYVCPGGEIIIGDMQLASGWHARLNPFTIFLAKRYGGTLEGHRNSQKINEMMERDLVDLRKKELFFKAYYYCIGKIR
jgi:demethylmenaquinone methyltransferase/2-methoxy-6-polyprenyl-1,4-benzoquinol methylase